jgi:hypothetical protein
VALLVETAPVSSYGPTPTPAPTVAPIATPRTTSVPSAAHPSWPLIGEIIGGESATGLLYLFLIRRRTKKRAALGTEFFIIRTPTSTLGEGNKQVFYILLSSGRVIRLTPREEHGMNYGPTGITFSELNMFKHVIQHTKAVSS